MTPLLLAKNLFGLSYILKRDARYFLLFDCSRRGFWGSFWAAGLTLPVSLFGVVMLYVQLEAPRAPVWWFLLVHGVSYAVSWLYWPNMMITLTRAMERQDRYYRYLVPLHWFRVVEAVLEFPLIMIAGTGAFPQEVVILLGLVVMVVKLYYQWFMARTALDMPTGNAVSLVLLDLFCGAAITYTATTLY